MIEGIIKKRTCEHVAEEAPKQPKIGGIPESLQAKIREHLQLFPREGKYKNSFKLITDPEGSSYLAREHRGVLSLGTIQSEVGKGGYGSVHEVHFSNTDESCRKWALKRGGEGDEVIQFVDGEGITTLSREVAVIREINPKGEISLFPSLHGEVTEKQGSREKFVGYLTDLGKCNYGTHIQENQESSFDQIGEEFYDMAQSLALLHKKHMHGDVHEGNFLCTEGGEIKLIDYGRARELNTLWDRIDDDAADTYTKLPFSESNRFNALPGKIEVDIDELLEEAEEQEDEDRIAELLEERESLKRACPEEAKAMDIFALGRVFYLRCYGKEPYTDEDLGKEDVSSLILIEQNKLLPAGLKELIEKMLSPNPGARPRIQNVLEELALIFPGSRTRPNESWIQEIERFFEPLQRPDLLAPMLERFRGFDFFSYPTGFLTMAARDLILSTLIKFPNEAKKVLAFRELCYCQEAGEQAVEIDQSLQKVLQGATPFRAHSLVFAKAPNFIKKILVQEFMKKNDNTQAKEVFQTIQNAQLRNDLQKAYGSF